MAIVVLVVAMVVEQDRTFTVVLEELKSSLVIDSHYIATSFLSLKDVVQIQLWWVCQ